MKFAGKNLNDYLVTSWKFLVIGLILTMIRVVLNLLGAYLAGIQTLLALLGLIVVGGAGWTAVRG